MKKIQKLKEELKALTVAIKKLRPEYKQAQRDGNLGWDLIRLHLFLPIEFREKHIAYCVLRGTPYEKIEPKVNEGNEPNWTAINKIMEAYREQPEVVCDNTVGSV